MEFWQTSIVYILIFAVVLSSAIWAYIDANRINSEKYEACGIGTNKPFWIALIICFLWILAFPMYLIWRQKIIEGKCPQKKELEVKSESEMQNEKKEIILKPTALAFILGISIPIITMIMLGEMNSRVVIGLGGFTLTLPLAVFLFCYSVYKYQIKNEFTIIKGMILLMFFIMIINLEFPRLISDGSTGDMSGMMYFLCSPFAFVFGLIMGVYIIKRLRYLEKIKYTAVTFHSAKQ
ncbi:MAG: hypothetical protein WC848_02525 [Parcubacteria group bacterium]|jgi:hypothetical protein